MMIKKIGPSSYKTPPHGGLEDNDDEEINPKVGENKEINKEGEEIVEV